MATKVWMTLRDLRCCHLDRRKEVDCRGYIYSSGSLRWAGYFVTGEELRRGRRERRLEASGLSSDPESNPAVTDTPLEDGYCSGCPRTGRRGRWCENSSNTTPPDRRMTRRKEWVPVPGRSTTSRVRSIARAQRYPHGEGTVSGHKSERSQPRQRGSSLSPKVGAQRIK